MFVVAAAATEAASTPAQTDSSSGGSTSVTAFSSKESADAATAQQQRQRGSKWVIDENEVLQSTLGHKAWTYGCMALLAASLAEAGSHAHSYHDVGVVGGAVLAAYVLSDLGTAVFHWGVDNYGTVQPGRQRTPWLLR